MTPIYHPNVDITGRICLDMLVGGWCPTDTLFDLLECVKYLIYHPNVDDPLMPDRVSMLPEFLPIENVEINILR